MSEDDLMQMFCRKQEQLAKALQDQFDAKLRVVEEANAALQVRIALLH